MSGVSTETQEDIDYGVRGAARYSQDFIKKVLAENDAGATGVELSERYGFTPATLSNWKKKRLAEKAETRTPNPVPLETQKSTITALPLRSVSTPPPETAPTVVEYPQPPEDTANDTVKLLIKKLQAINPFFVVLNFARNKEIFAQTAKSADEQMRPMEQQILYTLKKYEDSFN